MRTPTKTLLASLGALLLTAFHHFHGATIYDAAFRRHVAFGILPVVLLLILAYWIHRRRPASSLGRAFLWLFMIITLVVSVGLIGLFEGGYNHLLKNVLFFGGVSGATFERFFPPPAYETPDDLWFEVTGIFQFFVGISAGYFLADLWRERRREVT